MERAKARAMWIGTATAEANDVPSFPFKDSEALRWKADAAQRAKANAENGKDGRRRRVPLGKKLTIAMSNGGHNVVKATTGTGWMCTMCRKRSAVRWKLATKRCEGSSCKGWTSAGNAKGGPEGKASKGHTLFKSGTLLWFGTCGAFAETRANRLQKICVGPPPSSMELEGLGAS